MKDPISFFSDLKIYRIPVGSRYRFVVAYGGAWIPGQARTRLGALKIAWRAHKGEI